MLYWPIGRAADLKVTLKQFSKGKLPDQDERKTTSDVDSSQDAGPGLHTSHFHCSHPCLQAECISWAQLYAEFKINPTAGLMVNY